MSDVVSFPSCSELLTVAAACRAVVGTDELAAHHRIRRAVFAAEQGLFDRDDRDAHDDHPATVHALGFVAGIPVGTVRLYPLGDRLWRGDRLGVLASHRRSGIGAPLVRWAVDTAAALGDGHMQARVQSANTDFFLTLGWRCEGAIHDYLGAPHQTMTIALTR